MSRTAAEGHARLAQEVIDEHLNPAFEQMRAGEAVDVAGLYRIISTQFVARVLGVPTEDCAQFVRWAEDMAGAFDLSVSSGLEDADAVREAAAVATREMNNYSTAALEQRRRSGNATDLLGALATTDVPLTEKEKHGYVTMLIQGMQDTTVNWAKNVTVALAQHPDQRRAVAEDRTLVRQALDEIVRWQAPV
jgi:cytochrome P450